MVKELTYEELLKEINAIPDVVRSFTVTDNKQALSRRRSRFFGGERRS